MVFTPMYQTNLCLQDPYILVEPTKYAHLNKMVNTQKNYKCTIINS